LFPPKKERDFLAIEVRWRPVAAADAKQWEKEQGGGYAMPAEYLDVKLKPIVAGINPSCRVVSCRGPRILTTCNALLVTPEPHHQLPFSISMGMMRSIQTMDGGRDSIGMKRDTYKEDISRGMEWRRLNYLESNGMPREEARRQWSGGGGGG
jgi:hypothetical protein